jgi:Mg2+ and Co2+ transporter CorA
MLQQDYYFLQINDLINSNQLAIVRWIALAGQLLTVIMSVWGMNCRYSQRWV